MTKKTKATAKKPKSDNIPIYISTLRPGLLVSIKTSIKGNVTYDKSEEKVVVKRGVEISEWRTEKTVRDPVEQKAAVEIRSKARQFIVGVCAPTEFGLLCPEDKRADLEAAFTKARRLCTEFNLTSKSTRLKFNAIAGRIAPDDLEAVRAINGEVRDLIGEMQEGIDALDTERVRDAAGRAKKLGNMLAPEAQERIEDAVKAVRAMAVKMTKAGEQAATEVDAAVLNKLTEARTAFLDLDDGAIVQAPVDTTGRTLDLAPHEATKTPKGSKARELEIE